MHNYKSTRIFFNSFPEFYKNFQQEFIKRNKTLLNVTPMQLQVAQISFCRQVLAVRTCKRNTRPAKVEFRCGVRHEGSVKTCRKNLPEIAREACLPFEQSQTAVPCPEKRRMLQKISRCEQQTHSRSRLGQRIHAKSAGRIFIHKCIKKCIRETGRQSPNKKQGNRKNAGSASHRIPPLFRWQPSPGTCKHLRSSCL